MGSGWREQVVSAKKVPWFSHLPQYERETSMSQQLAQSKRQTVRQVLDLSLLHLLRAISCRAVRRAACLAHCTCPALHALWLDVGKAVTWVLLPGRTCS